MKFGTIAILAGILVSVWSISHLLSTPIDYNTEVKPILNKHCMGCHGGVKKAGDVSFLFEHEMYEKGKSGKHPVVKGDWKSSEMMVRILSTSPEERMPKDAPALSQDEITTLKKWIDEGAKWDTHWAYKSVDEPVVPSIRKLSNFFGLLSNDVRSAINEVDHFVLNKLWDKKLHLSKEADKATLIRRVSLDLTGLPPTPEMVTRFLQDESPDAYEKLVDTLLNANSYGERWASMWLDLARYADTKGYEQDGKRNIWRYRDYVIASFNANKPFSLFTKEQMAGDLMSVNGQLPSEENLIATAFHRNTMTNDEGGTLDEEYRIAAVIDRVNTTWEVWHGTTFACVQCHSHTYDPIKHDEYYKYLAFFNNTRDEDISSETPTYRIYEKEDTEKINKLVNWISKSDPVHSEEVVTFLNVMEPKSNSHNFASRANTTRIESRYFGIKHNGSTIIPPITFDNKSLLLLGIGTKSNEAQLRGYTDSTKTQQLFDIRVPYTKSHWADTTIAITIPPIKGSHELYLEVHNPKAPEDWVSLKWVSAQKQFPTTDEKVRSEMINTYVQLLHKRVDDTPILWEAKGDLTRKTTIFERGNWLVHGKEVQPNVPSLFITANQTEPSNRLELAEWMVNRDNPLTARVFVNRIWEQLFGKGIVETTEDFGSQGSSPTHQELLDWLSVQFMEEYNWQIKPLLKTIVMSATYRQTATATPEKREADPYNDWLSYGPRVRLSAEQIRDQALAVSGLLSSKMYGKSVMPPQPEGIWMSPYSGEKWEVPTNEDRYRRALYTFWKRTAPYPSMVSFDAPSREFCQSRRLRTNTPLQALVLMNDPVYIEAAEKIASKMKASKGSITDKLSHGYELLTFRNISTDRLKTLQDIYNETLSEFKSSPNSSSELVKYSDTKDNELAALTVVANVLLNLDEVVTK